MLVIVRTATSLIIIFYCSEFVYQMKLQVSCRNEEVMFNSIVENECYCPNSPPIS